MKVSKRVPQAIHQHIEALERHGYQVDLRHQPETEGELWNSDRGHGVPYRGFTCIQIVGPNNEFAVTGESFCSVKDQFDRAVGTRVAFNHALHHLTESIGRREVKRLLAD